MLSYPLNFSKHIFLIKIHVTFRYLHDKTKKVIKLFFLLLTLYVENSLPNCLLLIFLHVISSFSCALSLSLSLSLSLFYFFYFNIEISFAPPSIHSHENNNNIFETKNKYVIDDGESVTGWRLTMNIKAILLQWNEFSSRDNKILKIVHILVVAYHSSF